MAWEEGEMKFWGWGRLFKKISPSTSVSETFHPKKTFSYLFYCKLTDKKKGLIMVKDAVRKHMNHSTKIAGLLGIIFYMGLGYFLKIMKMYYSGWKKDFGLLDHHLEAAHVHGMLLGFMLLFYSFFVEVSCLDAQWKRIGSKLAIGGAILMPLAPLTAKVPAFFGLGSVIISHLSVIMLIGAMVILAWGHIKKLPDEQRVRA